MGTAGSFFYHALLMVKSTSYWLRNCDRVIILRKGGLEASGFDMRAQIIWAKDRFAISIGTDRARQTLCGGLERPGRSGEI